MSEISDLVERFVRNRDAYLSGDYNETQLRLEFLNPFFAALGWDVENKQGYAEAYKDVIHEDAIKIGGATKAPDYCFRIGGARKFFVEAKKPSVNLSDDGSAAFQLRRYAWSAKLPLSILTNFEELAVYDCREKPSQSDKASTGRTLYLRSSDYETRWEEISNIFSKEAVLKGSFDKYVESQKAKKGTAEVDEAFLKEIEGWRDMLARHIAMRNPNLTQRDLNFAVQRTIDRIVFLRICEDRSIETCGALMALLNGERVYKRLCELFYRADERYNSDLFHFQKERGRSEAPDKLALNLEIDDKPLKDIIKNLYYPDSPYEFSVLPADILGQVYEQFLGKIIRLTSGHRAVVEDKPEVKKAGGVYYTPTYIVDYIVKNTVDKLLENKTPRHAAKLRILDPACGSGSFLIGAYQYLLDWHRDWYVKDGAAKWTTGRSPLLHQVAGGDWRLTTAERKRILLDNIYGVDIDPQAVEVTKLSLLLKVLEGENEQTLAKQLKMFHERALPDLGNNIKCGNSLIGPDFYNGQQMSLLDEDERYRINIFDWHAEFPEIMKAGGFDAVMGNPPYLFITELVQADKQYFFDHYKTSEYRFDVYGLFIELSINRLLNQSGYLSLIIPHTLLSNDSFKKLRRLLLKETFLVQVIDIGSGVFERAKNETMIFVARQGVRPSSKEATQVILTNSRQFPQASKKFTVRQDTWMSNPNAAWLVRIEPATKSIVAKLEQARNNLGKICTINQGLRTGNNEKYLAAKQKSARWKPAAGGKHVGRYEPLARDLFVYYDPEMLDAPRRQEIFESPSKLVIQEIRNITLPRRLIATYDDRQFYCLQSTNLINLRSPEAEHWDIKFLLGILNSNAANFYFRQRFSGNNHIASNQLAQIPIPFADQVRKDKMLKNVNQILKLHKQLAAAKTAHEKTALQRQIDTTDRQIDALVYELYGLTEKEIRIVEGRE